MHLIKLLIAAFVGLLISAPQSWPDEWRASAYQSAVYVASIRNSSYAGIDIECRATDYGASEVILDLRIPPMTGIKPANRLALTFTTGDLITPINVQRLGRSFNTDVYRWTVWDQEGYEAVRGLGDALTTTDKMEVKDAESGGSMTFSFDITTLYSVGETIRRCGKEAVRARDRVSRMSDPKQIITLADDANDRCRDGSGNDPSIACDERLEYLERLKTLKWCYGKAGQVGTDTTWHRCIANSIR